MDPSCSPAVTANCPSRFSQPVGCKWDRRAVIGMLGCCVQPAARRSGDGGAVTRNMRSKIRWFTLFMQFTLRIAFRMNAYNKQRSGDSGFTLGHGDACTHQHGLRHAGDTVITSRTQDIQPLYSKDTQAAETASDGMGMNEAPAVALTDVLCWCERRINPWTRVGTRDTLWQCCECMVTHVIS